MRVAFPINLLELRVEMGEVGREVRIKVVHLFLVEGTKLVFWSVHVINK